MSRCAGTESLFIRFRRCFFSVEEEDKPFIHYCSRALQKNIEKTDVSRLLS